MNYQIIVCLSKLWKTELERQNRDYSIAMKVPHYMKELGLRNVACRMNDKVTFLEPEQPQYIESLDSIVRADHWSEEKNEQERVRGLLQKTEWYH